MSLREAKSIYLSMLDNGDLEMMLPESTGLWKEDKKSFMVLYQQNKDVLNMVDINLDDLNEEY